MNTTYITYAVYLICLILFLWGISVKHHGQIHTDYLSVDAMKSIRGFAAIGVILHHISQEEAFQGSGELSMFVNNGYQYVALFFFCSGYGLLKSLDTRPGYMDSFLKKRLPVIVIPYYTSIVFYGIYNVIAGNHLEPLQWFTNIVGVTMMNEYAWYPIILTILYIAFYLLFRREGSRKRKFLYMLLIILAMGMIFCVAGHFPWWAGSEPNWWMNPYSAEYGKWWMDQKVWWLSGEWWVNSQIAFLLGMIYETNEEKITAFFAKRYPLKIAVLIILTYAADILTGFMTSFFGYWSEFAGKGPGIVDKILCYFTQLPHVIFFTLFIIVFTMKIRSINPVTKFFGKYSLDTYMMNLMPLLIFRPLFLDFPGRVVKNAIAGRALFAVCVFAATIMLALIYHKVNELIRKALIKA